MADFAMGAMNTKELYALLYTSPEWTRSVITRNSGLKMFTEKWTLKTANAAILLSTIYSRGANDDNLQALITTELAIPIADPTVLPDKNECMRQIMARCAVLLEKWNEYKEFFNFGKLVPVDVIKSGLTGLVTLTLPLPKADTPKIMALKPDEVETLWTNVYKHIVDANIGTVLQAVTTAHVALIKQGMATPMYLNNPTKELDEAVGVSIDLETDAMRAIYTQFLSGLTPTDVEKFAVAWRDMIPPSFIRARLVLERAVGHNLICFSTIKQAILMFPKFEWSKVIQICGQEQWTNYKKAALEINDNAYFGYTNPSKIRDAASTKYKILATACAKIIEDVNSDKKIMAAQSFLPKKLFASREAEIGALIASYKTAVSGAVVTDAALDTDVTTVATTLSAWRNV